MGSEIAATRMTDGPRHGSGQGQARTWVTVAAISTVTPRAAVASTGVASAAVTTLAVAAASSVTMTKSRMTEPAATVTVTASQATLASHHALQPGQDRWPVVGDLASRGDAGGGAHAVDQLAHHVTGDAEAPVRGLERRLDRASVNVARGIGVRGCATIREQAELEWCTSGSTAAANVAPSAAFFADAPLAAAPFLYA
eukprot:scaffold52750_cov55-Phaeocystis_antarctica.AAC.2